MKRARWTSTRAIDAALALLVLVVSVAETLLLPDIAGPRWANALVVGSMAVLLLWRRHHPVAMAVLLAALAVPQTAFLADTSELIAAYLSLLVLAYGGGAYTEPPAAWAALAVLGGTPVGAGLADGAPAGDIVFPCVIVTLCWLAGRTVRTRTRVTVELHESAVRAAEQREAEARHAVADERRRIAREMHDVVAHSISIMVVQAGGARRILVAEPERAEQAAERIGQAGREAIDEMDVLLDLLRPGALRARVASLDGLPQLVERARDAGLDATLRVVGAPRTLPAGAGLAAYRVVQEALTNAIKHAAGASAVVELRWGERALELRVTDTGGTPALTSGGHGLVGMRERVRLHGGELQTGPLAGGGFEVAAQLPIAAEPGIAVPGGGPDPAFVAEPGPARDHS